MVAEDESTPMPEKRDPWTQDDAGTEAGGQAAEFVETEHNEPGSQQPPGQDGTGSS